MKKKITVNLGSSQGLSKWYNRHYDDWVNSGYESDHIASIIRKNMYKHQTTGADLDKSVELSINEANILLNSIEKEIDFAKDPESNNGYYDLDMLLGYEKALKDELDKHPNVFLINIETMEIEHKYCVENPKEFAFEQAATYFSPMDGKPEFKFIPTENYPDRYMIRTPGDYTFHYFQEPEPLELKE